MSFFSEILDVAVMDILMTQKDKLLNNIKIEVTFEELEKVVKEKEFFLIKNIIDILSEDTDDFEAVEKIVCLLKENHLSCGGRHDF